jgi:hypothetical protein
MTADEVTFRQNVEFSTDYCEAALGPQTLEGVAKHLVICDWYATCAEQMHATVAALRASARWTRRAASG